MVKVRKVGERLKSLVPRRKPKSAAIEVATILCRDRARTWVHAYAAGGAAYSFVPLPIPGSTTAGLVAIEATMVHAIGRIYGVEVSARDAAMCVAGLEVAGGALRVIAREAALLVPLIGWLVRGSIAAVSIEAIGNTVVTIFEKRYPGRFCASV